MSYDQSDTPVIPSASGVPSGLHNGPSACPNTDANSQNSTMPCHALTEFTTNHFTVAPSNRAATLSHPLQALYQAFDNAVPHMNMDAPSYPFEFPSQTVSKAHQIACTSTSCLEDTKILQTPSQAMSSQAMNATQYTPHISDAKLVEHESLDTFDQVALAPQNAMSQASSEVDQVPLNMEHTFAPPESPATITTAEDIKPLLEERLPKDASGSTYRGYIRGLADFTQQSQLYESLSNKTPGSAEDFPGDDAALEALARGLTDAMTNMKDTAEAGKKSVTRIYQLSPYEIEMKSWKLLFTLRDVQLGRVDLHLWGAEWEMETFETFIDRYEDVRNKLSISKSLVSSLFDQEFGVRLALAPGSELKKKLANSKNNSRRAVELAGVREHKKRSLGSNQNEEMDKQEEESRTKRLRNEEEATASASDMPKNVGAGSGEMTASVSNMTSNDGAGVKNAANASTGYDFIQLEDFRVDLDLDNAF